MQLRHLARHAIFIALAFACVQVSVLHAQMIKPASPAVAVQPNCDPAAGVAPYAGQVISTSTTTTVEHPGSDAAAQFAMAMKSLSPNKTNEPPPLPRYKPTKVKTEKVHDLPHPVISTAPVPFAPGQGIAGQSATMPGHPAWSSSTSVVEAQSSSVARKDVSPLTKSAPCAVPST